MSTRLVPQEIITKIQGENFKFDEWSSFFSIKSNPNEAPVRGSYRIENNNIVFRPMTKPDPKLRYLVTFSYQALSIVLSEELEEQSVYTDIASFAPPESTQPEIVSVTPDLEIVPANLIRFYVFFSAPMGNENPYNFINIKDKNGISLEDPFVIVPEGLWNIDRNRLTLLLHPGSEGDDLVEGDVLRAGNDYQLEIDENWKGASGQKLKESFTREINATNPLRRAINVNLWALRAEQNQLASLTIVTDHPLDQPLAKRMLYIRNKQGQILPSQVEFTSPEKLRILWRPEGSTELELHIDHRLEDVCGNTPLYAFDKQDEAKTQSGEIMLNFKIN